jgi:hypothetical protein
MRYMSLIRSAESVRDASPPRNLIDAMGVLMVDAFKAGVMVDTGGLLPDKNGFRARLAKGKLSMTDGPFTEAKEVVGGYAIMEFATRAEAEEWTRRFMLLHSEHWPQWEGECEVRPMYGPGEVPGSCDKSE